MGSRGLPSRRTEVIVTLAGIVVFVVIWAIVGHRHAVGIDRRAFDYLGGSRTGWLAHHARRLALLVGGGAAFCSLLAILFTVWRRRWRQAAVITIGYILVLGLGRVVKQIIERPRPAAPLVAAGDFAFPSTDTAVSVGLVVVAIVLAGFIDRIAVRWALIGFGVVLSLVAGLLMVMLRVHYLTDVLAGWAFGAIVFAVCDLVSRSWLSRPWRLRSQPRRRAQSER